MPWNCARRPCGVRATAQAARACTQLRRRRAIGTAGTPGGGEVSRNYAPIPAPVRGLGSAEGPSDDAEGGRGRRARGLLRDARRLVQEELGKGCAARDGTESLG